MEPRPPGDVRELDNRALDARDLDLSDLGLDGEVTDPLSPAHVARVAATLDAAPPADGVLPLGWHVAFFAGARPTHMLRADGHPQAAADSPLAALPQRMYAGFTLEQHRPFAIGQPAQRSARIEQVTHKQGRSGAFTLVSVAYQFSQGGAIVARESHRYAYRSAAPRQADHHAPLPTPRQPTDGPTPQAANDPSIVASYSASEALLFRFSAVTFNTHRIHYDRDYCQFEGHPDLVVHGPLTALWLLHAAVGARPPDVCRAEFTATSPLYVHERVDLRRAAPGQWTASTSRHGIDIEVMQLRIDPDS